MSRSCVRAQLHSYKVTRLHSYKVTLLHSYIARSAAQLCNGVSHVASLSATALTAFARQMTRELLDLDHRAFVQAASDQFSLIACFDLKSNGITSGVNDPSRANHALSQGC